ncbi:MAG: poly(3-hydroxybutyrate) depolymerase [Rhodomicrobium sp.]
MTFRNCSTGGGKPLYGFLALCIFALTPGCGPSAQKLPALGADLSQTSVSGLSSGGYMAGQFHVAHSATVIGAAILAAGPYGCAESAAAEAFPYFPAATAYNAAQAQNGCMADRLSAVGVLSPGRLVKLATSFARDGKIDPLPGLKRTKVYLYTGADDRTVAKAVVEAARNFYLAAGLSPENVSFVFRNPGGHAFLTADEGNACASNASPYIDDCRYDQAEVILRLFYGALAPKASARAENFITFAQGDYASSNATLASDGVVYVPSACRSEGHCRVHIVFHGCDQSRAQVGDAVIRETGFADWAETNKIIVLFPQAAASALNPLTCWDWWGYTGLDFLTRNAPQIEAVESMLTRLSERPAP